MITCMIIDYLNINDALTIACQIGNKTMIGLMISKGANDWNHDLSGAVPWRPKRNNRINDF